MILTRTQQSPIRLLAFVAALLSCGWAEAQIQPANPSFSSTADVNLLNPSLTQFGTFRQGNPGATLNFNVYNLPAASGTTSPMSLVQNPPASIGNSTTISLQTPDVIGLQPVSGSTPSAPMQLAVSTSQAGNFQVSYQLEFASDSLSEALHQSLAIAAYATVLLHGDFNADGKVDAGDYVIWRKTNGQAVVPYTQADDNGDGQVTIADYTAWRAAYAGTPGSGSDTLSDSYTIPEPTSIILILFSLSPLIFSRIRRQRLASDSNLSWR